MAKIGIFWIYNSAIFGKAVSVEFGIDGIPGMIDCVDTHADVWELERPWATISPALTHAEYQDIPRGRVLFLSRQGTPLVYADKNLMTAASKLLIAAFFGFDTNNAIWKRDVHYTTSTIEIDVLFDDE